VDLPNIVSVLSPHSRDFLPPWQRGSAWLAGGTWLFSEPQPALRILVDLAPLGWPALEQSPAGLRIAATCTIKTLEAFVAPADWLAAPVFAQACRSLLGSFKIWAMATIGGNVCLALPAAPMLALTVALDGTALIWRPDGTERSVPMADFCLGARQTVLTEGELLRAIDLPVTTLSRRVALRQASLTTAGRSAALLIATLDPSQQFALTITASVSRPLQFTWPTPPPAATLDAVIQAIPAELWYDDVHGTPAWRRHMTRRLAGELLQELAP
jgi:CO/xanthine dehydrogenase FAD-binding subunit